VGAGFLKDLHPQLDFPFDSLNVADGKFGASSVPVFLEKNKGADGLVFSPARSIK